MPTDQTPDPQANIVLAKPVSWKIKQVGLAIRALKVQLLVLLTLVLIHDTSLAVNINSVSLKGLSQAYGFLLGQDYSLNRVEAQYPDLRSDVALARLQFSSAFGDIQTKLETELTAALGAQQLSEVTTKLQAGFPTSLGQQPLTRASAVEFLGVVAQRARGEIATPVLEYLLAVRYQANPVAEFLDGFRQRYQSDGLGKSQGVTLRLQLPRSWASAPGERPHIVQKWTSENGTGLAMIHLDIRDAQGYSPTRKEMDAFVKSGEIKDVVPDGSTYVASGSFSLERQAGYWLQMTMPLERGEFKWLSNAIMYQVFFRGKAIGIMCQAGAPEHERQKSREAFDRIRPLCQQVLNSLVLPQAY